MAAWFASANSQGLANLAFPLSTFPFSIGAWVYPVTVASGVQCIFTASIVGTGINYVTLYIDNAALWTVEKTGGGVVTCGTAIANEWHYCLLRVLTATSVRVSVLNGRSNNVVHADNTTAGAMTGFTGFTLGDFRLNAVAPTNFFDGGIGELFITNTNCHADVGQAPENPFVRRLAYEGPFASLFGLRGLKDDLIEYRSLFSSPERGHGDEIYSGFRGMQNWVNTNGVMNGPHPPLAAGYVKPRPVPQLLMM